MQRIEQWKPVKGYEGIYKVSNIGRVNSLKYGKEKILKPGKNGSGYLFVYLWKNGKYKMFLVHRLVATAFLPNPEGFEQVNHKDENPSNNCIENLEWCTPKYNSNYGTRTERQAASKSKPVEASKFPDFREIELRFDSIIEAGRNWYSIGAVSKCCRGCYSTHRRNFYKGLYWRYADESENAIMQERQILIFMNVINNFKEKCLI